MAVAECKLIKSGCASLLSDLYSSIYRGVAFGVQGHKLSSVSLELVSHRKNRKSEAAVAQTNDVVASQTGDKWTQHAGGLYPYLKTKRGKVNSGQDNVHSSVRLPAPPGNASSGLEMTDKAKGSGVVNGGALMNQSKGVTAV